MVNGLDVLIKSRYFMYYYIVHRLKPNSRNQKDKSCFNPF